MRSATTNRSQKPSAVVTTDPSGANTSELSRETIAPRRPAISARIIHKPFSTTRATFARRASAANFSGTNRPSGSPLFVGTKSAAAPSEAAILAGSRKLESLQIAIRTSAVRLETPEPRPRPCARTAGSPDAAYDRPSRPFEVKHRCRVMKPATAAEFVNRYRAIEGTPRSIGTVVSKSAEHRFRAAQHRNVIRLALHHTLA
jgi:hypothetical protein